MPQNRPVRGHTPNKWPRVRLAICGGRCCLGPLRSLGQMTRTPFYQQHSAVTLRTSLPRKLQKAGGFVGPLSLTACPDCSWKIQSVGQKNISVAAWNGLSEMRTEGEGQKCHPSPRPSCGDRCFPSVHGAGVLRASQVRVWGEETSVISSLEKSLLLSAAPGTSENHFCVASASLARVACAALASS